MKKFINAIDDLLVESLSGFAAAHRDLVSLHLEPNYLTRAQKAQSKVVLISGGGSGHEPLHNGFIGYGMLDAACPGRVSLVGDYTTSLEMAGASLTVCLLGEEIRTCWDARYIRRLCAGGNKAATGIRC